MPEGPPKREYGRTPEKEAERVALLRALEQLLERLNPAQFNDRWLKRNGDHDLYWGFVINNGGPLGEDGWRRVVGELDPKWQSRFDLGPRRPEARTEVRASYYDRGAHPVEWYLQRLEKLLDQEQPASFSPGWIAGQSAALYQGLRRRVRNEEGQLDWTLVVGALNDRWKSYWHPKQERAPRRLEKTRTKNVDLDHAVRTRQERMVSEKLDTMVVAIQKLLTKHSPEAWSPNWVDFHHPFLYEDITHAIRVGAISSWDYFVQRLGLEWKERWKKAWKVPARYELHPRPSSTLAGETYNDPLEVDTALAPYADKLYTLVAVEDFEDKAARDAICRLLIQHARQGNIAAKEKFVELLYPLIQEWLDQYQELEVLRYDSDVINDQIERCVAGYKGEGPFLRYLLASIKGKARVSRSAIRGSLDQPLRGDEESRTLAEKVGGPAQEEEDTEK